MLPRHRAFGVDVREVDVGSLATGSISSSDDSFSRPKYVAVLRMNGRNASITDLGSHNGTFVNGRRLGADEACQLHDGDTLRFGVVDASYRLGT
jgi:hypothetical protein